MGLQYRCTSIDENVIINREADSYDWVNPIDAIKMNLENGTLETLNFYLKRK